MGGIAVATGQPEQQDTAAKGDARRPEDRANPRKPKARGNAGKTRALNAVAGKWQHTDLGNAGKTKALNAGAGGWRRTLSPPAYVLAHKRETDALEAAHKALKERVENKTKALIEPRLGQPAADAFQLRGTASDEALRTLEGLADAGNFAEIMTWIELLVPAEWMAKHGERARYQFDEALDDATSQMAEAGL